MLHLTPRGREIIQDLAQRHNLSEGAILCLLEALVNGHGTCAQFNHPELGGFGQWMPGGMIQIGDMFNHALKAKVDAVCRELSALIANEPLMAAPAPAPSQSQFQSSQAQVSDRDAMGPGRGVDGGPVAAGAWWPREFGTPGSVGAQNDMRYAVFPGARRLVVEVRGVVTVYDTRDHRISGVSQQQGGSNSLTFTSQRGVVDLAELPVVKR